jgi:hypothetical protein
MTIKVINKKWKIVVRTDRIHHSRYGECHGIAIAEDRRIHIRRSSLNEETIIHELVHAYQFELSFHELQLDDDQVEEWFAELFAKYGRQIIKDTERLLSFYRERSR